MLQQLQKLASNDTIHGYQTCPLLESFPRIGACNILFAQFQVEDCLEMNVKYLDYQLLMYLSYSYYVCWRSVRATRVKCYLSVQVSVKFSIPKRFQINCGN